VRVIGTAGHVDHGKSTLIQALTGIDPDRLREEKERGMTIDLGFAWLKLPNGQEVSIVDVPGHERFIHNMLAGIGGIDIALLVVAADEGIMPQTREHLAILDLLGVESGAVAVTKTDLVDADWLELVLAEIEETLADTSLAGAPIVPVSSVTRQGLDDLRTTIEQLLVRERSRPLTGKPRLPVDRVFTMAGFGTVVTGTLIDGELRLGQELELQPSGRKTRVRGLQSHKKKAETVPAGSRVAVNLSGLPTDDVKRGDVLTSPGWLRPTRMVDARLRLIDAAPRPLTHNSLVAFHTGAAETLAKVGLLDTRTAEAGESVWVQVRLQEPLAVAKGDLFVIRWPSPSATIGGGTIVEPYPRRHRRFQEKVLAQLAVLEQGSPREILLEHLAAREPTHVEALVRHSGLPAETAQAVIDGLVQSGEIIALDGQPSSLAARASLNSPKAPASLNAQTMVVSAPGWERLVNRVSSLLAAYHRGYPLRPGMPKEGLRTRLEVEPRLFQRLLQRLIVEGQISESGPLLKLAEHTVSLTPEQEGQAADLLELLRRHGPAPPDRADFERELSVSPELTQVLLDRGQLVEVSADLLYPKEVYDQMVGRVVDAIRRQGPITVAGVRDLFDTSRKYALALMGHLDERKITRRVGDERVLHAV
jgi:selenocysteine-specific elongation factor